MREGHTRLSHEAAPPPSPPSRPPRQQHGGHGAACLPTLHRAGRSDLPARPPLGRTCPDGLVGLTVVVSRLHNHRNLMCHRRLPYRE